MQELTGFIVIIFIIAVLISAAHHDACLEKNRPAYEACVMSDKPQCGEKLGIAIRHCQLGK